MDRVLDYERVVDLKEDLYVESSTLRILIDLNQRAVADAGDSGLRNPREGFWKQSFDTLKIKTSILETIRNLPFRLK